MADLNKTTNELNRIYSNLKEKAVRIINTFKKLEADVEWCWCAGHSIEHKGALVYEQFPIPVITIGDVCEIGVDLKGIYIEGKLFAAEADGADFSLLEGYDFCVYGAREYLTDLYDSRRDDIAVLNEALFDTEEFELCIDLVFKDTPPLSRIVEACALMQKLGTHAESVDVETALDDDLRQQ